MTTSFGIYPSRSLCFEKNFSLMFLSRLLDIVHADQKLYLVFEFLDVDLKRYIETGNQNRTPISLPIVKVRRFTSDHIFPLFLPFLFYLWHAFPMFDVYTRFDMRDSCFFFFFLGGVVLFYSHSTAPVAFVSSPPSTFHPGYFITSRALISRDAFLSRDFSKKN